MLTSFLLLEGRFGSGFVAGGCSPAWDAKGQRGGEKGRFS